MKKMVGLVLLAAVVAGGLYISFMRFQDRVETEDRSLQFSSLKDCAEQEIRMARNNREHPDLAVPVITYEECAKAVRAMPKQDKSVKAWLTSEFQELVHGKSQ